MLSSKDIARIQEEYYSDLMDKHGPGVDAVASGKQVFKNLRYKKLSAVFKDDKEFTLHDVGFGIGHYFEYLNEHYPNTKISYSGSEITKKFVDYCKKIYPDKKFILRNLAEKPFDDRYDYLVFGGTFYHSVNASQEEFTQFVKTMIRNAFTMCRKGVSFNLITDHVEYRQEGLYYGSIKEMTDFAVEELSRYFTVDHAYPLYEFTMCVYQEDHIKKIYPASDFQKYYKK